jgi:hypothetical protein
LISFSLLVCCLADFVFAYPAVSPAEPSSFLPMPAGHICVALACLLLSGVPKQCTRQAVAATCKAQEAWLVEPDAACCTFNSPE